MFPVLVRGENWHYKYEIICECDTIFFVWGHRNKCNYNILWTSSNTFLIFVERSFFILFFKCMVVTVVETIRSIRLLNWAVKNHYFSPHIHCFDLFWDSLKCAIVIALLCFQFHFLFPCKERRRFAELEKVYHVALKNLIGMKVYLVNHSASSLDKTKHYVLLAARLISRKRDFLLVKKDFLRFRL